MRDTTLTKIDRVRAGRNAGSGVPTLTAAYYMAPVFEDITDENAPLLLYLDANKRLQVGTWGYEVKTANAVHTKFGSTVGFAMLSNSDSWGAGDVTFNPTSMLNATFEKNAAGYNSIPAWVNWPGTKPGSYGVSANLDYISSNTKYHTVANVKAGFGDICQLVGYAAENIAAWSELPPATYRLPTNKENNELAGYPGYAAVSTSIGTTYYRWISGSPGYVILLQSTPPNLMLPALGDRHNDGEPTDWNVDGHGWSSTPHNASGGYALSYSSSAFYPSESVTSNYNWSNHVRCVRQ